MSSRYFIPALLCAGLLLAIMPVTALAQCGAVADPGFESQALGSFTGVVSPQFTAGYWGAESSTRVGSSAACPTVSPRTGNFMLEMSDTGGVNTEVWQAIPVGPDPAGSLSVSAWFTACEGIAPRGVIQVRTYNSLTGWNNPTFNQSVSLTLDADAATWEQVVLDCVEIPVDTEWVLVDIQFPEADLANQPGFVDDVEVLCNCLPVPTESRSFGTLKALHQR